MAVYHDSEYLDFILSPYNFSERLAGDLRHTEFGIEEDCPAFSGLSDYVCLVAGASLKAADTLQKGEAVIAICWDGGRHHAQKSHASGFCYVADCILAILALKRSRIPSPLNGVFRKPRIMYLDLDLHFSDGVSQAFASSGSSSNPQILTLSIHHTAPGFFPISPLASLSSPSDPCFDPFTLSLPLSRGASDATFARVWKSVEKVKDAFQPNYVVVQCGVDGLAGDPYAIWNWSLGTTDGSLGWCIDRVCNSWRRKTLLLGGGGYNSPNAARAWAYLTSIALRNTLPLDADIPDHAAFPLYSPSFTLDVPAGNAPDQNTDEYLDEVEDCFARAAEIIEQKLSVAGG
ncbi:hypothetical protein PHLCEN_2v3993 [Hermanssonia centrifuga]|uniref:histone deacetylase n=1 Tax=Hermanssonia centrifuga TaxID=98765 RepID=A0A2R6Q7D1_9APHY|nr:hypothetical protein PHLCEN_2v3993 [Hermanssonia centrifuga]